MSGAVKRSSIIKSEDDMTHGAELPAEDAIGVYLALFSAVIDVLGVAMVVPILPYYAESFGADASQLGLLYSAFAAAAVVSTLLMGTLSDIFGRRALIIASLCGSCTGLLFHGFCQNYSQLLAARIYTGFFSSSLTIAQAYVADVVPGPLQPKYMANLGAATGVTYMVGPTIGGAITAAANNDYSFPYFVASATAGMGMLFAIFKLEEPKKKEKNDDVVNPDAGEESNMTEEEIFVQEILKSRLFGFPTIVYVLGIVRFFSHSGFTANNSMFALFAMDKFGINAVYLSTMMMVGAICFVIVNITLFKWVLSKLDLINTMSLGMFIMGIAVLAYTFPGSDGSGNLWLTFVIQWCLYIGFAFYMPSITSLFAKFTTPGEKGKILGCGSVFLSGAEIVGPVVFGALYQASVNSVWYAAAGSLATAFVLLRVIDGYLRRKRKSMRKVDNKVVAVEDRPAIVEEDWVYEKDKPYSDEDYIQLGKRLGAILSRKNWRWKQKMVNVERIVEATFPHIPEEVMTSSRMWDHFWVYNIQLFAEHTLIHKRRDEDYKVAEQNGWDFSVVERPNVDLTWFYAK